MELQNGQKISVGVKGVSEAVVDCVGETSNGKVAYWTNDRTNVHITSKEFVTEVFPIERVVLNKDNYKKYIDKYVLASDDGETWVPEKLIDMKVKGKYDYPFIGIFDAWKFSKSMLPSDII